MRFPLGCIEEASDDSGSFVIFNKLSREIGIKHIDAATGRITGAQLGHLFLLISARPIEIVDDFFNVLTEFSGGNCLNSVSNIGCWLAPTIAKRDREFKLLWRRWFGTGCSRWGNPAPVFLPHLTQLPLHHSELAPVNARHNSSRYERPDANPSGPPIYLWYELAGGLLMGIFGLEIGHRFRYARIGVRGGMIWLIGFMSVIALGFRIGSTWD